MIQRMIRIVTSMAGKSVNDILLLVDLEDTMDDRYVTSVDLEDDNVTNTDGRLAVMSQQEEITTMERGLHASTTNTAGVSE